MGNIGVLCKSDGGWLIVRRKDKKDTKPIRRKVCANCGRQVSEEAVFCNANGCKENVFICQGGMSAYQHGGRKSVGGNAGLVRA